MFALYLNYLHEPHTHTHIYPSANGWKSEYNNNNNNHNHVTTHAPYRTTLGADCMVRWHSPRRAYPESVTHKMIDEQVISVASMYGPSPGPVFAQTFYEYSTWTHMRVNSLSRIEVSRAIVWAARRGVSYTNMCRSCLSGFMSSRCDDAASSHLRKAKKLEWFRYFLLVVSSSRLI